MYKSGQGRFRARLFSGTGLAVASLALCVATGAYAQTATPTEDEEIIVTGSRLTQRGFDAATPVAVLSAEEVQLSGTVNVEELLQDSPQFVASINGGATSNTVPGGNANVNLRGFGPQRNLVLVNGRRFAIQGPDQTTDLNTIPSALVERTEIVTGGSSAVYGSDAITGVVNFIMRDDFEGIELSYQRSWDDPTGTPVDDANITIGGNFDGGRGNLVLSVNYLNRGAISRGDRGEWALPSLADGCVTAASWSESAPGTPLVAPGGQTCRQAGGIPGLIAGGSGDIPFGRFSGIPNPGGSNAALNTAYANAGLSGMGAFGFTFDEAGATARPALDPQDRFNLGPDNYLVIPQERWMANAFGHYDITDRMTGYVEFHFSNNTVNMQLAPTNVGRTMLLDTDNQYLSPAMQQVLVQLDAAETTTSSIPMGSATYTNAPNDGRAALTIGRRFVEVGNRFNSAERVAWRAAFGVRGDLGDFSESFLRDLTYDVHYQYSATDETDLQNGSVSISRYQAALLQVGSASPVCNIFGANVSEACATAIAIDSANVTKTEMQGAAAILTGTLFDLWAGPVDFSLGAEWREAYAKYSPDSFLASGDVAGFNPSRPTEGSESVREFFGEVRVPILSDAPLADHLNLNGAFRYSDYDLEGVGGVWTYSEGIEWSPVEDLTVRGQFQHAIRAPNVGELFGGQATNFNNGVDPCGVLQPSAQQTQAVRDVCIATGVPSGNVFTAAVQSGSGQLLGNVSGGNPDLAAEESDTITYGAVLRPRFLPGFVASVDYFKIELEGAIAPLAGGLAGTLNFCYNVLQDASSVFCQAVNRDANGVIAPPNYVLVGNSNIGGIETSGVDFAANYDFDLALGFENSSTVSLATSWTWTDEFTLTPVQDLPDTNECVGAFGQTCGEPIPEWKGVSRITWATGPLQLSVRHRYQGEVTVDTYVVPTRRGATVDITALTNPVLDAMHYFDVSFTYDVGERLRLYGGVNNATGEDPPIIGSPQVRSNTWPATYDTLGRQFFLGATVQLH